MRNIDPARPITATPIGLLCKNTGPRKPEITSEHRGKCLMKVNWLVIKIDISISCTYIGVPLTLTDYYV